MAVSKSETQRVREYNDKHTKQYALKFNTVTDADVLEKLDSVPSKQGYIKELVRRDIRGV